MNNLRVEVYSGTAKTSCELRALSCQHSGACSPLITGCFLLLHPPLVRAGNFHVLAILCHRTASHLNSLRLKDAGNLLIGQRLRRIFFFNQLLHSPLQNQQRGVSALWPVDALAEEIAQLEDALWSMRVLAGDSAADGRGMDADFFRHFLNHHRLQFVDALFQKILLPAHNGVADFQNRLLPLLNVLDELDCALEPLLYVIARIAIISITA